MLVRTQANHCCNHVCDLCSDNLLVISGVPTMANRGQTRTRGGAGAWRALDASAAAGHATIGQLEEGFAAVRWCEMATFLSANVPLE